MQRVRHREVQRAVSLPAVGTLVNEPAYSALATEFGRERVVEAIRRQVEAERQGGAIEAGERLSRVAASLRTEAAPRLRRVINATGVILHTNLGRAPLSRAAVEALAETSAIPVTVGHLPQERLPAPVEAAGYFLIAEASGLIATRPGAEGATVDARHEGNRLIIQITSDAAAQPGQDLENALLDVTDRVGALGGRLRAGQAPAGAITIEAEIPCGS